MKIVFRVDSSAQMGSGHLMRCLTLANELRRRGAEVSFVSRLHVGHLIHKLEEEHYVVHKLEMPSASSHALDGYEAWLGVSVEQDAQETLGVLDGSHYDWLIVDHYALGAKWEKKARVLANKVMAIDDLADRDHDCDVLLDQNYFASETKVRYADHVDASTTCLLGPEYALLQPEYANLHKFSTPSDGVVHRVLVFLGNSDWNNQTGKVLEALNRFELRHLSVDVVVGSNHPDPEALERQASDRNNVTFHYDLPTLVGLMLRSDLVIGAGGATTWERMCLGKPSLVMSIANNQEKLSQYLAEDDYQVLLYNTKKITSTMWYQAILRLIKAPSDLKKMAKKSSQLVDGLGINRVIKVIEQESMDVSMRYANARDWQLLLDWANEASVRKQSLQQALITENEHKQWLEKKLADSDCFIFIASSLNGRPVGQVRFDLDRAAKEALVDISLDYRARGKGLGVKVLSKAMEQCLSVVSNAKFVAEVREENVASQKLFKRMNYDQMTSTLTGVVRFEKIEQI